MARASRAVIVAAACGTAAPAALADVLIADFETSDGGVQTWTHTASRVTDPTGDSAFMLQLNPSGQESGRWVWANWSNGAIGQANANANGKLEFDAYFPSTLWGNGTADLRMEWEAGGGIQGTTVQTLTVTPDTKQHVVIDYTSLGPITVDNGAGWFDLNLFAYPGTSYPGTFPQSMYIDNLKLVPGVPPPADNNGTWDPTMSGNWGASANWQSGVVGHGAASSATFPTPAAPQTVTADIVVPIGAVNLNGAGANGYTIDAAVGKAIVLSTGPAINVNGGTHSITAPLTIPDGVTANIAGGGSLTINTLTHSGYGGFNKTGDGTLSANRLVNMTLGIDGGTVNLLPGNAQAYGFIYAASLANGATLNLNDNQVRCNGVYGTATETVNIGTGGTLTIGEFSDYDFGGTIAGGGNIVVGWQASFGGSGPAVPSLVTWSGNVSYTGTTLVTNASTLVLGTSLASTSAIALDGNSTIRIASAAGNNRVIKTSSLSIESGSKIDLTDNKLITATPLGTWDGTAYTGVSGYVDAGRGPAGNALWDGTTGITTSDTRAINNGDLVSIGVAKVSDVRSVADTETTTFAGQTVLGSDTLAMVTWGGDANLDGKINIDDYGRIDGNVGQSGSVFGWSKGDFNYDGKINIDDYGIIDGNINRQGAVFPTAGGGASAAPDGVAAVPEPGMLSMMTLLTAGALRRRRRN